ncbi:hypothetical protein AVEN_155604-1 [Araneus ventricosus]|uniref:Uncharacterized protein n=1 Tax=Araneus ventricosus TaxID=182803 RepID=A0A4Y2GFZ7_ARAVE|nr:hypothetical protein AVEN_107685-1 [Araneus ventricosus]GBM52337.1 hypothetical protein AVEN_155604-1 [Araneus ventricosus]
MAGQVTAPADRYLVREGTHSRLSIMFSFMGKHQGGRSSEIPSLYKCPGIINYGGLVPFCGAGAIHFRGVYPALCCRESTLFLERLMDGKSDSHLYLSISCSPSIQIVRVLCFIAATNVRREDLPRAFRVRPLR